MLTVVDFISKEVIARFALTRRRNTPEYHCILSRQDGRWEYQGYFHETLPDAIEHCVSDLPHVHRSFYLQTGGSIWESLRK